MTKLNMYVYVQPLDNRSYVKCESLFNSLQYRYNTLNNDIAANFVVSQVLLFATEIFQLPMAKQKIYIRSFSQLCLVIKPAFMSAVQRSYEETEI